MQNRGKFRKDYFKRVRAGEYAIPNNAFEENYLVSFLFKKTYKSKSKLEILEKLIDLAKIKISGCNKPYKARREKKHGTKKKCFCCGGDAYCQHHIILLKNGGHDSGINRIPICGDCHKIIHPWLA